MLITYGPFALNGVLEPESSVSFNSSLKSMDKEYGIRDIRDLQSVAENNGMKLKEIYDMPSNNKTLVWVRKQ